jgi:hypothetical protein
VESCCEFGDEPSGPSECWETSGYTAGGLTSSAQLHIVA